MAAITQIEEFWHDLVADIKANRVVLPALPDVAIKVRRLLDNPRTTVQQVASAISADVVLTTRLLRVVNSALYRAQEPIDSVRLAVTRLGNANVRSIVTSLAMEQIYQDRLASPTKKDLLARNREHSMMVAALAWFISERYTDLNPEEAMLAGLIHDIGKLPIVEYSELLPAFADDPAALARLLEVLHPRVGALILRRWEFPAELIEAVSAHEDLYRETGAGPDYTDVVVVANLLSHIGTDHPHTRLDWSSIPAFHRLSLSPEESIEAMRTARERIHEIRQILAA